MNIEQSIFTSFMFFLAKVRQFLGWRFYGILGAQLLVGLFENLSIFALLPIIYVALDIDDQGQDAAYQAISNMMGQFGVPQQLPVLLVIFALLIFIKAIFNFLASYYAHIEILKMARHLRQQIIDYVFAAKWTFFSTLQPGKYGNIITGEIKKTSSAINSIFIFINALALSALYCVSSLLLSWKLTIFAFLFAVFIMVFLHPYVRKTRQASFNNSNALNNITSFMANILSSIKIIKSMSIEGSSRKVLTGDNDAAFDADKQSAFGIFILKNVQQPVVAVALVITILVSIYILKVPIVNLSLLLIIFNRSLIKLMEIQSAVQKFVNNEGGYLNVLNAIDDAQSNGEEIHDGRVFELQNSILVKELNTFANDQLILQDVNIDLPATGLFVFYGPSGGGKTTLVDTLVSLREDYTGDILYDGVNLQEISYRSLRESVGYVSQELQLFHTTVRENILLAAPDASDKELEDVLALVNASDFVNNLEHGANTIVGEGGSHLSGGQRQRLILARALIRKPKILILDEATSALDKENAQMIMDTICKVSHTACVIMITHDNSLLKHADHVYEIKDKKVIKIA